RADWFASAMQGADIKLGAGGNVNLGALPAPAGSPGAGGPVVMGPASGEERKGAASPAEPLREKAAAAPPPRSGRRWLTAALVLLLLSGLGLCEATGITHIRGTVLRLFSSEGRPAPNADDSKLPQGVPAPEGLVSCWRAEGNARDAWGGNHGTVVGKVSFTTGQAGLAFRV